jgi:16S rRNA (adenine1518-N6/adenine1519-N6)-dimethyltransferase
MTFEHPKSVLLRHGLHPKHHFGQSFLADANLATRIATFALPTEGGTVVEIGAGLGALTDALLGRAQRVVAIERDRDLLPVLRAAFPSELEEQRLVLLEADAKAVDYRALLTEGPRPAVLTGNLPYHLTGPLLRRAGEVASLVDRVVFLVQSEVGDRLSSAPGTKDYGASSIFVQAQFEVSRVMLMRRGAFYPQPNVDSAVMCLLPHATPLAEESPCFQALVHDAFSQRRKKLRNAWLPTVSKDMARLVDAARRASIDLDRRGEELSVGDYARMAAELSQ